MKSYRIMVCPRPKGSELAEAKKADPERYAELDQGCDNESAYREPGQCPGCGDPLVLVTVRVADPALQS